MKLFKIIRAWRILRERSLGSVAKEIGISVATLSRIERGKSPDADSMKKLIVWLMAKDKS